MPTYNFKLISSDNLETFLKALGVPEEHQKAAATTEVIMGFTTTDDGYTDVTTNYGPVSSTYRYKVGEAFEINRFDGKKIKALVTGEGTKFTLVEQHGDFEVKHVREFISNQLKQTSTVKGVTLVQMFNKI